MTLVLSRRDILYGSVISVSVGIVGCLGSAPVSSNPTNEEAKQRAIDAEESYLYEQLQNSSCLTGYGTMETTGQTTATVSDRTTGGVVVEVTHAYWYRTEELESDGESEARYLVSVDDTRRIDGSTISPC